MEIYNMVPHPVWLHLNKNKTIIIPPRDNTARVAFSTEYWKTINNIPIHNRITKGINGLPRKLKKDVLYIVSSICQDNMDEDILEDYIIATPDKQCGAFKMHDGIVEVDKLVRFTR